MTRSLHMLRDTAVIRAMPLRAPALALRAEPASRLVRFAASIGIALTALGLASAAFLAANMAAHFIGGLGQ